MYGVDRVFRVNVYIYIYTYIGFLYRAYAYRVYRVFWVYRVHRACASRVYRVTWFIGFIEFMRCTGLIGSIDGV